MTVDEAMKTPFKDKENGLASICRKRGLHYGAVVSRIKSGWSVDDALNTPLKRKREQITIDNSP